MNYHQMYFWPRDVAKYPVHDVKLISKYATVTNLNPLEDVYVSGYLLRTLEGSLISAIFVEFLLYKSTKLLIYSHSNSTDIGCLVDNLVDLALNLEANVLAYEYSGYG